MDHITKLVVDHFDFAGRSWPTLEDGLLFLLTEVAEASELVLRSPAKDYKRNHPKEGYSQERFAEELGDIIYMAIVTGKVARVDPIRAMLQKMSKESSNGCI